jgi:hypothetical protein
VSYEKAKEAVRKNAEIFLNQADTTKEQEMIYNLSKSLDLLIQAVENDIAQIKRTVTATGGQQRQQ